MKGTIARIVRTKGFGFIMGTDMKDYFFHMSDFNGHFDDLATDFEQAESGDKIEVTFTAEVSPKGLRGRDVKRTDGIN